MDDEAEALRAKLQATKLAVEKARLDAAQHVQHATRQIDYRTSAMKEKAIDTMRQRVEGRRFEGVFDKWVDLTAEARQLDHLLWLGHKWCCRWTVRRVFIGWRVMHQADERKRVAELRDDVQQKREQLAVLAPDAIVDEQERGSPPRPSAKLRVAEKTGVTSPMSMRNEALQKDLDEGLTAIAAAEAREAAVAKELTARRRALQEARRGKRTHSSPRDGGSETSAGGETARGSDVRLAELQEALSTKEQQIDDAEQRRSALQRRLHEQRDELEDELAHQTERRAAVDAGISNLEAQLERQQLDLAVARNNLEQVQQQERASQKLDEGLAEQLAGELQQQEEAERKLGVLKGRVGAREQALVDAEAQAEEVVDQLRRGTRELKSTLTEQVMEQSASATGAALQSEAVVRQLAAKEEELATAEAALKHGAESLRLLHETFRVKLRTESNAATEKETRLQQLQDTIAVRTAQSAQLDAEVESRTRHMESELAIVLANADGAGLATEQSKAQCDRLDALTKEKEGELSTITDKYKQLQQEVTNEQEKTQKELVQQLSDESIRGKSERVMHESATKTYARTEERLRAAKDDHETLSAKFDAQRADLEQLLEEALRARQEAEQEKIGVSTRAASLRQQAAGLRASLEDLNGRRRQVQEEAGDERRSVELRARFWSDIEDDLRAQIASQEALLSTSRGSLEATRSQVQAMRQEHGSALVRHTTQRKLAEQEVGLLRGHMAELERTNVELRASLRQADAEVRRRQVQVALGQQPALLGRSTSPPPRTSSAASRRTVSAGMSPSRGASAGLSLEASTPPPSRSSSSSSSSSRPAGKYTGSVTPRSAKEVGELKRQVAAQVARGEVSSAAEAVSAAAKVAFQGNTMSPKALDDIESMIETVSDALASDGKDKAASTPPSSAAAPSASARRRRERTDTGAFGAVHGAPSAPGSSSSKSGRTTTTPFPQKNSSSSNASGTATSPTNRVQFASIDITRPILDETIPDGDERQEDEVQPKRGLVAMDTGDAPPQRGQKKRADTGAFGAVHGAREDLTTKGRAAAAAKKKKGKGPPPLAKRSGPPLLPAAQAQAQPPPLRKQAQPPPLPATALSTIVPPTTTQDIRVAIPPPGAASPASSKQLIPPPRQAAIGASTIAPPTATHDGRAVIPLSSAAAPLPVKKLIPLPRFDPSHAASQRAAIAPPKETPLWARQQLPAGPSEMMIESMLREP